MQNMLVSILNSSDGYMSWHGLAYYLQAFSPPTLVNIFGTNSAGEGRSTIEGPASRPSRSTTMKLHFRSPIPDFEPRLWNLSQTHGGSIHGVYSRLGGMLMT